MSPREIPLSTESWLVLQRMAKGASLTARRIFPFPHTFHLAKPDNTGEYAAGVAPKTIDQLVTLRLVSAALEGRCDRIEYRLTARANTALARGALFEEDHAIDLFAEAS